MKKLILVIGIVSLMLMTGCALQKGYSTDTIYGYDTGFLWSHLYLTNDHSTEYCIKPGMFDNVIELARKNNTKVEVDFEKHLIKGSLCDPINEKYEKVIVTDIQIK